MRNDFPQIPKRKGLRIPNSAFRIPDSRFRIPDSGFRIPDSLPSQTLQKHGGQQLQSSRSPPSPPSSLG